MTRFSKYSKNQSGRTEESIYNISDGSCILYEIWSRFDGQLYNTCWISEPGHNGRTVLHLQRERRLIGRGYITASFPNSNFTGSNANSVPSNPKYMKVEKEKVDRNCCFRACPQSDCSYDSWWASPGHGHRSRS